MKKFGFAVIVFVFSLFIASPLPSSPSMEELEGTLEVIMATKISEKTCQPLYFINVSGKKTQFSLPARAPLLSPGQKIKISGRWEEDENTEKKRFHCRKVEPIVVAPVAKNPASAADNASDYLPRQKPVLGEQNVLIVCLNSPDTRDSSPSWDKEKIDDKIFSNPHSLNAYWKACSVDNKTGESRVWLSGDILNNGNWKTLPKNFTEYGYGSDNERDWRSEFEADVIDLIDPEVDFSKSKYDEIIVFRAGKKWFYDWSSLGKLTINTDEGAVEVAISYLTENDIAINNDYASHESGHGLFSLPHANSKTLSGKIINLGDWWDNRGWSFGLSDTLHRYMLGWLDVDQIKIVFSSGEYWLDQRELASDGLKLLVIFIEHIPHGSPILIYMEYHRGLGEFDSQLSFSNKKEAVDPNNLVLLRKYEIKYGGDSLVYVADDAEDCLDLESNEFCDEEVGFCVQVLEKTGGGGPESKVKVKITLTENYSTPTPTPSPTPTPTPSPIPSPTPSATPTPTPTPALGEIVLSVSLNKQTVRRGGKIRARVETRDADGNTLLADKISCQMTKSDGERLYAVQKGTAKARFSFKISKKYQPGRYKITATASKEGYEDAVNEKFFEVK